MTASMTHPAPFHVPTKQEMENAGDANHVVDKQAARLAEKDTQRINRDSTGYRVFTVFNWVFFILFTIICAYPFYYLIINSVSNNQMSASGLINWVPSGFHLDNYVQIFQLEGLGMAAFISVARTVLATALTVIASAYLGFMFTQQAMWHRSLWYRLVIITMYFNAGIIPVFITYQNLGLTNTFWVYILPAIVQPFNIILVKTFIESIPSSLQEAAEVDGAGVATVFWRIILPMCKPILATVAIFSAVGQWNAFQDTLIFITNPNLYSLQYVLYTYLNQATALAQSIKAGAGGSVNVSALISSTTPQSIQMTIAVVVVLPILFIYPFFQRYFVKGMFMGAIKG